MRPNTDHRKRLQAGQTLIIAILVLGVLLILGFVFAGLVGRNITQTGRSKDRTVSTDMAEAGIRFAHYQLVNSVLGADWRPDATPLTIDMATGLTRDPDALYLRPGTGQAWLNNGRVIDRGGPDGLGPFSRVQYDRGRALIRIRYAPGDMSSFGATTGSLRQPSKARNYIVIESVGRAKKVDPRDPSLQLANGVRVGGYSGQADFLNELGRMKQEDRLITETRKVLAFASIGIVESARFIHNKFRVTTPAEIGSLTASAGGIDQGGLGVSYSDDPSTPPQPVTIASQYGGELLNSAGNVVMRGTGSLYSNANLVVHGRQNVVLSPSLGDMWAVAGEIKPANGSAALSVTPILQNGAPGATVDVSGAALTSESAGFSTLGGLLRDGVQEADASGHPRSIARKEPPSILAVDPATNANRYVVMTRESGHLLYGVNSGRFGHGSGVYVDARERGNLPGEDERERAGVARSLVNDWLNWNTSTSQAWQGPFYRPLAPYLKLLPDGFEIIRDSRSAQPYWRLENGARTTTSRARFRIRRIGGATGGSDTFILNSVQHPELADLPAAQLQDSDFQNNGRPFNGVILFEGDVRVRGIIPTDQQLTVVSMGTIYIEGSITKGVVTEGGGVLSEPSKSMLALMAKDYVAINTTQFFAPGPGEDPKPKSSSKLSNAPNPIELDLSETPELTLQTQFLLNPNSDSTTGAQAGNPVTWRPFANTYREAGSGSPLTATLLVSHAADNNGPSIIGIDVGSQTFADAGGSVLRPYRFPSTSAYLGGARFNWGIRPYFQPYDDSAINVPLYGLTDPAVNAYPRFETIGLPLVSNSWSFTNRKLLAPSNNPGGALELGVQDESLFRFRLSGLPGFTSKNYELARVAIVPHDIRIEATLFAEEGSFFVIPGPAFNTNQDDSREAFLQDVASQGLAVAQQLRFERFGASPEVPFYGEPLNVRISIIGAVSENMPPPISMQAEWQRRWGWMPRALAGTGSLLPLQHVPQGYSVTGSNPQDRYVPNITINYDSALALASANGSDPIRRSLDGAWVLPPMPRLPVSPTLAYFGEVTP